MSEQLFPRLFDQCQIARVCQVSERTVEGWRHHKTGPPYLVVSRRIRYDERDVLAFIVSHKISPAKRLGGRTRVTTREQAPAPVDFKSAAAGERAEE